MYIYMRIIDILHAHGPCNKQNDKNTTNGSIKRLG